MYRALWSVFLCKRIHTCLLQVYCLWIPAEYLNEIVRFLIITMPKQSSADVAIHAAEDLVYALKHPQPASPFDIGNEQLKALDTLINIFSKALPEPFVQATNEIKSSAAPRVELNSKSKALLVPQKSQERTTTPTAISNAINTTCTVKPVPMPSHSTSAISMHTSHLPFQSFTLQQGKPWNIKS